MNSFKLERIGSKIALEIDRMGQNSEITRYSRQKTVAATFHSIKKNKYEGFE